jgi:type I restriction enzyme S subunit
VIALLEEQRQTVIMDEVAGERRTSHRSRGLASDWLGQIPRQWEIARPRKLFRASRELARIDDVQLSATQAYGVIPQDEFEKLVGRRVVKISMHLEMRKHVEPDDFVMSMRSFEGGLERAWAVGAIRSSYVVLKEPVRNFVCGA